MSLNDNLTSVDPAEALARPGAIEARKITIDGQLLQVAIRHGSGSGPPLLLFNGIGANWELARPFLEALTNTAAIIPSQQCPSTQRHMSLAFQFRHCPCLALYIGLTRSLPLGGESIPILKGVSFTVDPGEWIALTGPSGSGKSTLLGILAGLDSPTSGRILVGGVDVTRLGERAMARLRNEKIGVVFQSFNLIPSLTAQENVEAPLHVGSSRSNARDAAREVLGLVGLSDRLGHRPHQLSGGQQQRVAIARAVVQKSKILLADEPVASLDPESAKGILTLLRDIVREHQMTVLCSLHQPLLAERFADTTRLLQVPTEP